MKIQNFAQEIFQQFEMMQNKKLNKQLASIFVFGNEL